MNRIKTIICSLAVLCGGMELVAQGRIGFVEAIKHVAEINNRIRCGDMEGALDAAETLDDNFLLEGDFAVSKAIRAESKMRLAMLYWNEGHRRDARRAMDAALMLLDSDCSAAVAAFKTLMDEGLWPRRFERVDFVTTCGILSYVMKKPMEKEARSYRSGGMIENRHDEELYAERRGAANRWNADYVKYDAAEHFRRTMYMSFDPENRPSFEGSIRDEWDACKRVCEILGRNLHLSDGSEGGQGSDGACTSTGKSLAGFFDFANILRAIGAIVGIIWLVQKKRQIIASGLIGMFILSIIRYLGLY